MPADEPTLSFTGSSDQVPSTSKSKTTEAIPLGLQIAQSRSYSHTLGPKVGIVHILGALEYVS